MTIECYFGSCKYHANQTDPEEGPFCYEDECLATVEEIALFMKEREGQLVEYAKISNEYEDLHYSKRLIKALDAMDEENAFDETLWPNRRHSEMFGFIWSTKDIKGCFH